MYYVICAAFIAMIGFYGAFQRLKRQPKRRKALTIACKCAATGMAVLVGVLGAARSGLPSNWVMAAGLIACMLPTACCACGSWWAARYLRWGTCCISLRFA